MTTTSRWLRLLCFASLTASTAAACSSSGTFATDPGDSVLTASVTTVTFQSAGGGLTGPRPTGAGCDPQVWTYTLALTSGNLTWSRCQVTGTGASATDYTADSGSRALSASELATATGAVRAVRVSSRTLCGADKPSWSLEVTSASAGMVYGDDFYACDKQHEHYVESDGLDNLSGVLGPMAHP